MVEEVKFHKCTGICGKTLELNTINFKKRSDIKSGFSGRCINCIGKSNIIEENGTKYKICTGECKLKLELNEDNFNWRNKLKTKYRSECKICMAKYRAEYYQENIEEISIKQKEWQEENKEKIKIQHKEYCEKNKDIISIKSKEYNKKYREENKDIISIKSKEYYEENKEEILIHRKEYTSSPEVKKKRNERIKQKKLNNPKFKLRSNISVAICNAFKGRNARKSKSISKSLPYTIDELITHLELWFKEPGNEWMTLNNNGIYNKSTWDNNDKSTWVWQFDHFKPESEFNYTSEDDQEFKDCWSLDNLRPLRADLNVIDGARRTRHNT